jgi:hypothetical protein
MTAAEVWPDRCPKCGGAPITRVSLVLTGKTILAWRCSDCLNTWPTKRDAE